MYISIISAIVGQAFVFGDVRLLQYAAVVWLLFHLFVIGYEEPTLRLQFGRSYDAYRAHVPRWLPRLRPWIPTT
jgi:protein-S-isoprenylcysteine O-methyltransferase Ste14